MRTPRALTSTLALAALAACAGAPAIRLTLPAEPLPDLFAPVAWTTSCAELEAALGAPLRPLPDGRGCAGPIERLPLGGAELALALPPGSPRFSTVTLTRRDAPPCAKEVPRPASCGADPSEALAIAFDVARRAIEKRIGPPLATLAEGRDRSAEWRQRGWTLRAGLYGPRGGEGWRVVLAASPDPLPAAP
jgi:hypothetical protein